MEMSRSWQDLGVVDTIYEDDHEEEEGDCFNSPTMSSSAATSTRSCSPPPQSSSLPPALRTAVQEWSRANGSCNPDVIVRVQEHCFPLHRKQICLSQINTRPAGCTQMTTHEVFTSIPSYVSCDGTLHCFFRHTLTSFPPYGLAALHKNSLADSQISSSLLETELCLPIWSLQ